MKRILCFLILIIICFCSVNVFAEEVILESTETEIIETDISQIETNESIETVDNELNDKIDYMNEILTKIYFYLFLFFYIFLTFKFYEMYYRLFDRIC